MVTIIADNGATPPVDRGAILLRADVVTVTVDRRGGGEGDEVPAADDTGALSCNVRVAATWHRDSETRAGALEPAENGALLAIPVSRDPRRDCGRRWWL